MLLSELFGVYRKNNMVDTVQEAAVLPVNSNGEVVFQRGVGSNTVVGYIASTQTPMDTTTNKMVVVFPTDIVSLVPQTGTSITTYDVSGKIATVVTVVGNDTYTSTYSYDTQSRVSTIVQVGGGLTKTATYAYNAAGQISSVTVV